MNYETFNMGAYNLHLINTKKFKSITIDISFRRKVVKEEITIRNLLKLALLHSTANFKTERDLIIESENLYDLKLYSSIMRIGNDSILSFRTKFLNEKYTEKRMNEESIRFLLDVILNPNVTNKEFDNLIINKLKTKLEKEITNLKDNKVKYSLFKLLSKVEDKPYSYNSYGYIDDLAKINGKTLYDYYNSVIENDLIDVFIVGDLDNKEIKNIFREYFKVKTYHKPNIDVLVEELKPVSKIITNYEEDDVNQSQLTLLCSLNNLTEEERKYVLPVYNELLGGSSNSMLFEEVREKKSYAYYVRSVVNPYDNILMMYSGVENGNEENATKVIKKVLVDAQKGRIPIDKLTNSKETIIANLKSTCDYPNSIISHYFSKVLLNSVSIEEKIAKIDAVTLEDVIAVAKKVSLYSSFTLKGGNNNEENKD